MQPLEMLECARYGEPKGLLVMLNEYRVDVNHKDVCTKVSADTIAKLETSNLVVMISTSEFAAAADRLGNHNIYFVVSVPTHLLGYIECNFTIFPFVFR